MPSSSTTNATCLPALRALRVVAIRPDAGQEDVADLVLARPVEDERLLEAADGRSVEPSRDSAALRLRQRRVVGVAIGDDLAGDAAPGGPDDRLIGIGDDDRVPAAEADAGPPIPGQFHATEFLHSSCTPRHRAAGVVRDATAFVADAWPAEGAPEGRSERRSERERAPDGNARWRPARQPRQDERQGAPAQSAPPVGGREDGT